MTTPRAIIANIALAIALAGRLAAQTSDRVASLDNTRRFPPVHANVPALQRLPPVLDVSRVAEQSVDHGPAIVQPSPPTFASHPPGIVANNHQLAKTGPAVRRHNPGYFSGPAGTSVQTDTLPHVPSDLPPDFIPWWDEEV